ncbi:MAG: alpha/beta fold hydrolase [Gammaproteobacteria bacterium]
MDRIETQGTGQCDHGRYFVTSDGAKLHYVDVGDGRTMVLVPGWSQTAALFKEQTVPLSKYFRCVAVDMRGHGESSDHQTGFSIDRLATDLYELISTLAIQRPIMLGHSMGASILWRYAEKFGTSNVSKMVFVDQAPVVMTNDSWSEDERLQYGGIFDTDALNDICLGLGNPRDGKNVTKDLLSNMFTPNFPKDSLEWVLAENLKFNRNSAVELLRDHCLHDWRSTIKSIDVPSLVIGGKSSLMPWQSQRWISQNMPDAKLTLFEQDEGGQHFMFLENPAKFNNIIRNFCQRA